MNPNTFSLFHFTKNGNTFKSILENGLRYSFAFEAFPDSIVHNVFYHGIFPMQPIENETSDKGFCIPMISFCDIPLTRATCHSKRYGKFALGVSKDYLCHVYGDFINPVFYADSKSIINSFKILSQIQGVALKNFYLQCTSHQDERIRNESTQCLQNLTKIRDWLDTLPLDLKETYNYSTELNNALYTILSLVKQSFGKNSAGKNQSFYDEREWRAVYPNIAGTVFEWHIGYYRDEFKDCQNDLNNALNAEANAFITIPGEWFNQITHIIVPQENDIPEFSNLIVHSEKLFGYDNIKDYERLHLLTKITSFERIENDY